MTNISNPIPRRSCGFRPGHRHLTCVLLTLCLFSGVPAEEPRKDLTALRKAAQKAAAARSLLETALSRARRVAWESKLRARDARQTTQTAREELEKARKTLAQKAAKNPPEKTLKAARGQVELIQLAHDRAVSRLGKADAALKVAGREFDTLLANHNKSVGEHTKRLRAAQQAALREGQSSKQHLLREDGARPRPDHGRGPRPNDHTQLPLPIQAWGV